MKHPTHFVPALFEVFRSEPPLRALLRLQQQDGKVVQHFKPSASPGLRLLKNCGVVCVAGLRTSGRRGHIEDHTIPSWTTVGGCFSARKVRLLQSLGDRPPTSSTKRHDSSSIPATVHTGKIDTSHAKSSMSRTTSGLCKALTAKCGQRENSPGAASPTHSSSSSSWKVFWHVIAEMRSNQGAFKRLQADPSNRH